MLDLLDLHSAELTQDQVQSRGVVHVLVVHAGCIRFGGNRLDRRSGRRRCGISGGIVKTGSASALPAAATGSMSITPASGTANVTVASTATLATGMQVTGAGIPVGSYITGITSGTVFTISQNATASTTVTATLGYGVVEGGEILALPGHPFVAPGAPLVTTGEVHDLDAVKLLQEHRPGAGQ